MFLWIGVEANAAEKGSALAMAQEYLQTHPSGRDVDIPIVIVKQGFEPPIFTGWFLAWDSHIWSVRMRKRMWKFLLPGTIITRWEGGELTQGLSKSRTFPPLPLHSLLFTFLLFSTVQALSLIREFTA